MFWRMGYHQQSAIDALLERSGGEYSCSLEDLLNEEELLQECKSSNENLIQFLARPEVISQLFLYITVAPLDSAAEERKLKYPYYSCEVLCCEMEPVTKVIFESNELLEQLFSFLNSTDPLPPLLASYFCRVVNSLITQRCADTLRHFMQDFGSDVEAKTQRYAKLLLAHIDNAHIAELAMRLMAGGLPLQVLMPAASLESASPAMGGDVFIGTMADLVKPITNSFAAEQNSFNSFSRFGDDDYGDYGSSLSNSHTDEATSGSSEDESADAAPKAAEAEPFVLTQLKVLEWWARAGVVETLYNSFRPTGDPEVHENCARFLGLCVLRFGRQSPHIYRRLFRSDCLDAFFRRLVHNEQTSVVTNGLAVLEHMLLSTTLSTMFSPEDACEDADANTNDRPDVPLVLKVLEQHFVGFIQLLQLPPPPLRAGQSADGEPLPTTFGVLDPPLGRARLRVVEFFNSLIHYCTTVSTNPDGGGEQLPGAVMIQELVVEYEVLPLLLELFKKYPWNSALHRHINTVVESILASKMSSRLRNELIIKHNLMSFLLNCDAEGRAFGEKPKGFRAASCAYVSQMANSLVKNSDVDEEVRSMMHAVVGHEVLGGSGSCEDLHGSAEDEHAWYAFVRSTLTERNRLDQEPLTPGSSAALQQEHHPYSTSDLHDEDDVDDLDDDVPMDIGTSSISDLQFYNMSHEEFNSEADGMQTNGSLNLLSGHFSTGGNGLAGDAGAGSSDSDDSRDDDDDDSDDDDNSGGLLRLARKVNSSHQYEGDEADAFDVQTEDQARHTFAGTHSNDHEGAFDVSAADMNTSGDTSWATFDNDDWSAAVAAEEQDTVQQQSTIMDDSLEEAAVVEGMAAVSVADDEKKEEVEAQFTSSQYWKSNYVVDIDL